jgi:gluconolactonase
MSMDDRPGHAFSTCFVERGFVMICRLLHGPDRAATLGPFASQIARAFEATLMLAALATATTAMSARAGELPAEIDVQPVEVLITRDYTEGVVVDHAGNLYISHQRIVTKITPDGKASTWAETGSPNGHKILADGTHLICDASRHAVLHLDADGKELAPAATTCGDRPLRGPNDLSLDPTTGGVYFTDPAESTAEKPDGSIHYIDPKGTCHLVADGFAFPNGIVVRPGGKELLVGESRRNRILAFPITGPGQVGKPKVLVDLPSKGPNQIDNQPDGIALDADGNLYVAHYGMRQVQVVSPAGKVIRRYAGGNLTTSNVAFAGPKMNQLYVTGGEPGGLFRLDLPGVSGLRILPERAAR